MVQAQQSQLEKNFLHPPTSAKPWVFWYWMNGNVSKQAITADLEAMQQVGLGGAYLMFIKDTVNPSVYTPAVSQLSKPWLHLVAFAIEEAKRLQLQLGFHVSDGFALAGGPWITPQLSMQKLVYTKLNVNDGSTFNGILPQPETNENYYNDIAIYAYPTPNKSIESTQTLHPLVTTSNVVKANFLLQTNSKESFKTDSVAWIQYAFHKPFTCRSIITKTTGNNYQAHRLIVKTSNDGVHFITITRLETPRHGWQDTDANVTHSIPATTAKYFRFVYDKNGTEPGSEDLDNAKWKPSLKISGIELSSEPTINQYEGKNGTVWRISKASNAAIVPDSLCVPLKQLINITTFYKDGKLNWQVPKGNWTIIRIGHTSTGHKNETAGGGKGLECDKFNAQAINLQFNSWFNKIYQSVDSATAKNVVKVFHVDSWECSSQNWSPVFAAEFKKRRGYNLLTYLPVMAGVPIQSAIKSEQVLWDVRKTINELVTDVFYATLHQLSSQKGLAFSAESVAPTMLSDGMQHYSKVDVPMGEFWNNSPTHDKPNDMLDAISGAHVYGKNIVQAEAFTTLRMNWDEHPSSLKTLGDRNYALGVNKMVLHVFTHNPFINKQPGVTLDGVGLYYQRNQTWFNQSNAWIDYMARCQALLQLGKPVADIAVFTGEELPRRAVLPDRLIAALPGIFGKERVDFEAKRLANKGQPMLQKPDGVNNSANNFEAADWVNPLNGYVYDSFNPDALMRLARVKNARIVLPSGASYKILVLPANTKMNPNNVISNVVVKKIIALVKAGATVLMDEYYKKVFASNGAVLQFINYKEASIANLGKGKIVLTPYTPSNFKLFQLEKDVEILSNKIQASSIAYTHRKFADADVYFISNQEAIEKRLKIAFRVTGKIPEIWNPVTGEMKILQDWFVVDGKTQLSCYLPQNGSVFVIFRQPTKMLEGVGEEMRIGSIDFIGLNDNWQLYFDTTFGGPAQPQPLKKLINLATVQNPEIKYYSGTIVYKNSFYINNVKRALLQLSEIYNIATVKVNGFNCGTIFTKPYQLDITKAAKEGINTIEIAVTNTWHNRLIGDHLLPENKRITFTTAPFRLEVKLLQPSGLVGDVTILVH
ncbi:MAG: glycosyl hydrolase [Flavobacterium sp.]|nr:glycosyl hydrolase [Flavobacterium sp.]